MSQVKAILELTKHKLKLHYVQINYKSWLNIHMNELHGVNIYDITILPFNVEVEVQILLLQLMYPNIS